MAHDVRELTDADLDACADLYVSVFNSPPWSDAWTVELARSRLADIARTPGFTGLVYLDRGIAGFVIGYSEQWFDGRHFYLKEMCVRPDVQYQGIGTRLIGTLEDVLRAAGISRIYLLTIRDGSASSFYAGRGYWISPKMALMSRRL